jgi:hypothetical protein
MSSHHFVKEGQEAALVILDDAAFEDIGPLLEWAPLVIVYESAAEKVNSWGIKIDAVVCQKKSVSRVSELLQDQIPLEVITCDSPEESTSFILDYLKSKGESSVTFVTNSQKELLNRLDSLLNSNMNVILICQRAKWSFIANRAFEKWMPTGMLIRIYPHQVALETSGLDRNEGSFKVSASGIVRITSDRPFWVGESI